MLQAIFNIEDSKAVSLILEDSSACLELGMMFRLSLPIYKGMLFVFKDTSNHGMWMKNVCGPLDFIFLGVDLKVIAVNRGAAYSTAPIYPNKLIKYVIEANKGWAKDNGVVVGTQVALKGLEGT